MTHLCDNFWKDTAGFKPNVIQVYVHIPQVLHVMVPFSPVPRLRNVISQSTQISRGWLWTVHDLFDPDEDRQLCQVSKDRGMKKCPQKLRPELYDNIVKIVMQIWVKSQKNGIQFHQINLENTK